MADSAVSPRAKGTTPQSVRTPPAFLICVQRLLGPLTIDWAADCDNVVGESGLWLGQDREMDREVVGKDGIAKIVNDDPGSLAKSCDWGEFCDNFL